MKKNIIISSIVVGCLTALVSFIPFQSSAQTSNPLIITWQANNYFPADYPGKALVTPNTLVIASVELVQKNKFIDLTKADIQWYMNDQILSSGTGMKTTSFSARPQSDGYLLLRVSMNNGGTNYENSLRIPTVQPKITLMLPNAESALGAGKQTDVQALPYFFNVSSLDGLSFFWAVNNQSAAGNGNQITINAGTPGSAYQGLIQIAVTAQNRDNPYEISKNQISFPLTQ